MSKSEPTTNRKEHHDRFMRDTLTMLGLVVIFAAIGFMIWTAVEIFLLAFAGILLAIFLSAPATLLSNRTPLNYGLGLAATLVVLLALAIGTGWLVGPSVADQATKLSDTIPTGVERVRESVERLPGADAFFERVSNGGSQGTGLNVASRVTGTASALWNVIVKLMFVIFLGLFLASAPQTYRDGAVDLFPKPQQPRAREVLDELGRTLQGWLVGQLIAMAIIGVLIAAGLWLIGIPLALVLGLIAGIAEFVPVVGPFIAFIPALLVALTQGTTPALYVIGLYIVVQQLEGNVIMPLVQRKAVDLPPALTLFAVFIAAAAFGFPGLLVATPLAAVGLVLVKMLYLGDTLNEPVSLPGDSAEG